MENQVLREFLDRNYKKRLNIHCLGDAMIDEYFEVKINRISPEYPVPVMLSTGKTIQKPGGVANVAYQFKNLNVDSSLIFVGSIQNAEFFTKNGLNVGCWAGGSIPIKRRYVENNIQVAPRLDIENKFYGYKNEDSLNQEVKKLLNKMRDYEKPDVVVFSDYDKGFFNNKENPFKEFYSGVKNIVDPKSGPLEKWKGCDIFKPNSKEALELTGKENWKDQSSFLQNKLKCRSVVITQGGEGVVGIHDGEFFEFKNENKVVVESVVGAGDCFVAFLAASIGHGFDVLDAVEIAFKAGASYVQNRMNRPIVLAELFENKIVKPEDLNKRDFKLVFTNGCFDILHKGHLETLKFAKEKGEKLVVALNTDKSIKKFKDKNRPIVPLEHRMAVMASLKFVDFVVSFDEQTPLEIIMKIKPDVLVKGADYAFDDIVGADIVTEVHQSPIISDFSTSKIISDYLNR